MILDIYSELQAARPAQEVDARTLYEQATEQARLADEVGFGCWWAVEHHTDPEFSFSSAPELVLTAIARHTRRIRLGTSGILSPFAINHPVRIAERGALVDVLSNGRLELGLAGSGGAEWETFGVDADSTREQLREALHVIPRIWTAHGFKWETTPNIAAAISREKQLKSWARAKKIALIETANQGWRDLSDDREML